MGNFVKINKYIFYCARQDCDNHISYETSAFEDYVESDFINHNKNWYKYEDFLFCSADCLTKMLVDDVSRKYRYFYDVKVLSSFAKVIEERLKKIRADEELMNKAAEM